MLYHYSIKAQLPQNFLFDLKWSMFIDFKELMKYINIFESHIVSRHDAITEEQILDVTNIYIDSYINIFVIFRGLALLSLLLANLALRWYRKTFKVYSNVVLTSIIFTCCKRDIICMLSRYLL